MKSTYVGIGALTLALGAWLLPTAPVNGGKGHGGGGHGGGGGGGHAAPAHVGSVHYAERPAAGRVEPARAGPAAHTGAVRSEHYEGRGFEGHAGYAGGYRNRYGEDYFNRFRPGYLPFILSDGYQYYGYYDLPTGYQQVVEDGATYYLFDGVYYQAYIIDGRTVYIVVPT